MQGLTIKQVQQLDALHAAGAHALASAAGPFDGLPLFNNMVLGRLQTMGLADSKVLRSGAQRSNGSRVGSQITVYWLTAEGRTRAEQAQ